MKMTREMFIEITEWQNKIFTKATSLSAAHHLEEEVKELQSELNDGNTGFYMSERKTHWSALLPMGCKRLLLRLHFEIFFVYS